MQLCLQSDHAFSIGCLCTFSGAWQTACLLYGPMDTLCRLLPAEEWPIAHTLPPEPVPSPLPMPFDCEDEASAQASV